MTWGNPVAAPANEPTVEFEGASYTIGSAAYIAKRDELIANHNASKAALDAAKETEMADRKAVAGFLFPNPKVGTNRVELNNGWAAKMVHKETTNIVASNDAVDEAEDKARAIGNEGQFLFERIITWEPKFSQSEYKKLDATLPTHKGVKALIDELIEKKNGAPTFELEAPKATLRG